MLISESIRPIQLNSAVLKRTPWVPSFSSSGAVGAPMPITRAVLGRDVVDVAERQERAGARLVLRHHGRIAGDVLADMAGEQPRIDVVAAGRRIADDELDLLALVELLGGLRRGGQGRAHDRSGCCCGEARAASACHVASSPERRVSRAIGNRRCHTTAALPMHLLPAWAPSPSFGRSAAHGGLRLDRENDAGRAP